MIFSSYEISAKLSLPLADLYWKECTIYTLFGASYSTASKATTNLLSRLNTDMLIGKVFPLSQLDDAFSAYASQLYMRIIIDMHL